MGMVHALLRLNVQILDIVTQNYSCILRFYVRELVLYA